MKKILFLLISLATFNNMSYASFPIQSHSETYTDTLQTDKIKQYHLSLIKMGIDLNSCKCESCRNGLAPLSINPEGNDVLKNTNNKSNATGLYILSGLILLGVIIWSSIGLTRLYNCADNSSDCPQSSGGKPNSGAPVELLWMSILILISVGVAIKARLMQLKNNY
jgi:hypothetical protein